jgi:cytochrome c peroxidase
VLGGVLAAAAATGAPPGPHGATLMPDQQTQLGSLLPAVADGRPPTGVAESYWKAIVPANNAVDAKRVALGKKLYFDTRLSKDGTVACATCHDVARGFTDRRPSSEGIGGQVGRRNAPTTLNALFYSSQFWDGRAASLEEQALLPIVNPIEMGQPNGDAAVKAIAGDAEYQRAFKDAYGQAVTYEGIGKAIASFERTLVFLDSPFDHFVAGEPNAMVDDAKAGWAIFNGKARCTACHQMSSSNPIGTDNRFHNIGVSARHQDFVKLANQALAALEKSDTKETMDQLALQTDGAELGRFVVSRNRADIGGFKTSQLRNVGITGPYMHDGSMQTLWDVIDHYNKGGETNPYLDGGIEPLALSEREVDQLVIFLFSLTDRRFASQNSTEIARQQGIARSKRPFRDEAAAMRKRLPFEIAPAQKSGGPGQL